MSVLIGGHSIVVNKRNLPATKIRVTGSIVVSTHVHSRIHDGDGHSCSIGSDASEECPVARNRRRVRSSRAVEVLGLDLAFPLSLDTDGGQPGDGTHVGQARQFQCTGDCSISTTT